MECDSPFEHLDTPLDEQKSWADLIRENAQNVDGMEFDPPARHAPRPTKVEHFSALSNEKRNALVRIGIMPGLGDPMGVPRSMMRLQCA